MSDFDKTVYSGKRAEAASAPPKRNPWLVAGSISCLLLICILAVTATGLYVLRDRLNPLVADMLDRIEAGPEATVVVEAPSPTSPPTEEPAAGATQTITQTIEASATPEAEETGTVTGSGAPTAAVTGTSPAGSEPEFGSITFALGADSVDYTPIDPGLSFQEGITEVHAIFEYQGMSSDYTWERVWFLDGAEVLRSAEPWAGAESGVFDYFINAGGEPLSPGEWRLELYVEENLEATGAFAITPETEPALAQATVTAVISPTVTVTGTPALTGTPTLTASTPAGTVEAEATEAATPESTLSGGGTYRLVFTKWDGVQHNTFVGDTDGSGEQLLVTRAAGPSWTPDGRYLFFYGEEGIDRQIRNDVEYVNPNYSVSNGIVRLTMSPFPADVTQLNFYQGPGWNDGTARSTRVSPNGQMVAFDAEPVGEWRIFFLGTTDNQQYRFQIIGEQPAWSPDSQKLVYRSGREGRTGIWISNRDDTGHAQITNGGSDSFPAWSPDGSTIVFSRDEGGDVDLYAMDVDGSNVRRLTETPGADTLPIFTPSGDIIFRSVRSGNWAIWKMGADGSNPTQIVADAPVGPDWGYSTMDVTEQ